MASRNGLLRSGRGRLAALIWATLAPGLARASDEPDRSEPEAAESTPGPQGSLFWIDAGAGYQSVDLTTFRSRRTAGGESLTASLVPSSAGGPTASVGAGVRVLFLTLGLRGSVAHFEDEQLRSSVGSLQLYSVDGEVGLDFLQTGRFVPSVTLGAGYSTFGGLDDAVEGMQRGLDVDGVNLRAKLGLDYYVSHTISLGARLGADVLFLSRPGVPLRSLTSAEGEPLVSDETAHVLRANGSSVGTALSLVVGPALHL